MTETPAKPADAPATAWVILADGSRVDCVLRCTGPREWTARPVRPIALGEMRTGHVDRLPAHAAVSFEVLD